MNEDGPMDPMKMVALAALAQWDLDVVDVVPIKVRENAVYAVQLRSGKRVALRVHRHGYHSDAALRSEFAWCTALAEAGIDVPVVVRSRAGLAFESVIVEGGLARQVDVFEWIDGRQLGSAEAGIDGDADQIARSYTTIGELSARMHNQSAAWNPPSAFARHAWDFEGLMGEQPLWGRFWELEALSPAQRELFTCLRGRVASDLRDFGRTADRFGLIHADLVPENVMVDGACMRIIDFDDAGYGWHLFEIATSLYFIRREPYYENARDALVAGYRRHRELSDAHLALLPMFLAARATTYLGWVHTRRGEPAAEELTPALIELAVPAAEDYLNAL
jgi:Ser/Thr protein kinase RdoA (MazF antagonist)